jgi:hypothetical protein
MKKTPSFSAKPRRSKSSQKRLQRKQQKTQSSQAFGYENLEPRYALDASFDLDNGLNLFRFDEAVTVSVNGGTVTATIGGAWNPPNPDNVPDNVTIEGGSLTVNGLDNDDRFTVSLGGNDLTFDESNFGNRPVTITQAGLVTQNGLISNQPNPESEVSVFSINGNQLDLTNDENQIRFLDVNLAPNNDIGLFGEARVFTTTDISGDEFSGASVAITTTGDVTYDTINANGNTDGGIDPAVDVDAAAIEVRNVTTPFTAVEDDFNQIGVEPISSVRLRATGGETAIQAEDENGDPVGDAPVLRENTDGGIAITGNIVSDQILLQSFPRWRTGA